MNYRFMDNRYTFYFISGILIVASILLLCIKGLNYGIDFKGGNILHVTFDNPTNETQIRDAFKKIGETNALYFSKDANALVEKISILVDNDELRQRMGKSAREYAEKYFSIENVVNKHLEIYNDLINRG